MEMMPGEGEITTITEHLERIKIMSEMIQDSIKEIKKLALKEEV